MAPKPQLFPLLALCLLATAAAVRDSFIVPANDKQEILTASFDAQSGRFQFYNETVEVPRRKALGMGQSTRVSTTFYNSPGMDCTTGNGQCGYGNDVSGTAFGGGGPFVETSLYPYHAASGNFDYLGGCGACGVLTYNGKSRGFVITDVTDHKDDIGGDGYHIDLCLPSFNYFTDGQAGDGSHGGIFTGTWTRVDCSCMGAPDYPDSAMVVRTQAWNQWAKAVVISRAGGAGEIAGVNFITRNGGFTSGAKVAGWGAWWAPTGNLGGQGGVALQITMKDGNTHTTGNFPLPDYNLWNTGNVYNVYDNVKSSC